jgi:hypothetical protein
MMDSIPHFLTGMLDTLTYVNSAYMVTFGLPPINLENPFSIITVFDYFHDPIEPFLNLTV